MLKKIISSLLIAIMVCVSFMPIKPTVKADAGYYCDTTYSETGSNSVTYHLDIPYDSYIINQSYLTRLCPNYDRDAGLRNSCAPTAGTIIMGYYDYEYPDLVPNFVTCYYYQNAYRYRVQNTPVMDVNSQLFNLMGTNTQEPGTSVAQFKNGLKSYVESCGLNVTYAKCGTRLNLNTALSYLDQQQPIAIFLNSINYFDLSGIVDFGTYIGMVGMQNPSGHVAVAFGYREYVITYNQNTTTYKYLIVSFGNGTQGLIPVDSVSIFDEAYAIDIY